MASYTHKYRRILLTALCLLALFAPTGAAASPHLESIEFIRNGAQVAVIQAEIAQTDTQKRLGLMQRKSLPENQGMLFLYSPAQNAHMWMKNTLIPLDMIFIDSNYDVVHIHENAQPHDLTPIGAGRKVRAVLELNGGAAQKMGIQTGDAMRIENTTFSSGSE